MRRRGLPKHRSQTATRSAHATSLGSTTCAPTSTSASNRTPSPEPTSTTSWPATKSDGRHQRQESERFKRYTYDELIARDKVSLDLFWLRDDSLEDIDNLPPPAVLATEIAEDLQFALAQIQALTATASNEAPD